jgi:hypothetical protein
MNSLERTRHMNDVVNPATYERLAISARDNGLYVVP